MKTFGLIGYPLGHSFSEKYFSEKFIDERIKECEYRNFPIENIEALALLRQNTPTLSGFNVTIPYKEQIIQYLDTIDAQAEAIGAVNCVRIESEKLTGYNTDAYGFRNSLLALIGNKRPRALILGTGGASKAVKYVLNELGIEHQTVSRTKTDDYICYSDLCGEVMKRYHLIINTTPLGTFPNIETAPDIPYDQLCEDNFLFDVVYNPPLTKFLALGKQHGAQVMNGYRMLVDQAEKSWKIWNR